MNINTLENMHPDENGNVPDDVELRSWRNAVRFMREPLLAEADANVNKCIDLNQDASPWRIYRQQLRDVTSNITEVDVVTWPVKPE